MPSPCSPVSRLPRAFMGVAVAARWPPRPRPPRRTAPTPPPAVSRHRAGRLRPRPQGGHSTTSCSSRPCGLRHPPPRRQTGHPWPPNRPPQNQGPTLPWRRRDKGGPSPLPEARTLWGGGEDVSAGPLHPALSAPLFPGALEGRDWTLVPAHGLPAYKHGSAGTGPPPCMDVVQSRLGAGGQNFREQAAFPRGLAHPAPPQGTAKNRHSSGDLAGSCLGAPQGPAGLDPHPRECRGFSACVCVAVSVFICMSLYKKQPSLWGSWTLHVRVSPQAPCLPPVSPGPCPSLPPPAQPALLFLAEKRIVGNFRTLPTHSPAPACWGCLHASPRAQGYLTPFPFLLLTKQKKEFKPPPGSVVLPPICTRLLLSQSQHGTGTFSPIQGSSHEVISGLCSQKPCLLSILSSCLTELVLNSRTNSCLPVCLGFT